MKKIYANKIIGITIVLVVLITSCTTKVKDIKEKRNNYLNKDVTVNGKVEITIPLTGIYQLNDDGSTIYVKTEGDLPNEGEIFKVSGKVKEQKFEFGGLRLINELYIEEKERNY